MDCPAQRYGGIHAGGWVNLLPASWTPWIQLCRLSPPAGLFLIYFPPLFGLVHAAAATGSPTHQVLRVSAALLVAALFGNNFGHAWNDLVDAAIDVRIARTRLRPIPRGDIAPAQAGLFAAAQAGLLLASLVLMLPRPTGLGAALASLPSMAGTIYYPFAKRHTHLPQVVLGFCLAWPVMVGSCAMGMPSPWTDTSTLALSGATVLWVVILDTVYAHQDVVHDLRVGVLSTAVLFWPGAWSRLFLWVLFSALVAALVLSGRWADMGAPYYVLAVGGCAASVARMIAAVDLDDPTDCWLWFSQGFWLTGLAVAGGLVAEYARHLEVPDPWLPTLTLRTDQVDLKAATMRTTTHACLMLLVLALARLLAHKAYPRPLPGIPYHRPAATRLWGDLPDISETAKTGGSFRNWFVLHGLRLNSPLTQVFLGPFAKPAIIVSDYREVSDILKHRDAVDFKRGLKVDAFRGLLPHAFPAMETFDPAFKRCRDLARDLMTPSVLHTINAPRIHQVALNLLDLWRLKRRLASHHPFDVARDISELSFDAILSAAVGLGPEGGEVQRQLDHLARQPASKIIALLTSDTSDPLVFEPAPKSAKYGAVQEQEESLWKAFVVPWPGLYHRLNNLRPRVRAARTTLRRYIASRMALALERLTQDGQEPHCALDYVIQREMRAAANKTCAPVPDDLHILEPVYGYLIAGHDTSSGSLLWLIRRLMLHPQYQLLIRNELRAMFPEALAAQRVPSAADLVGGQRSVWLDAFIQETLRIDTPVVNIMVMTRHDAVVLGHHVPADTRVFLNLSGPSINLPSIAVNEEHRSSTCRAHKFSGALARENWDDDNPVEFRPERWLRKNAEGKSIYDAGLGPELAFSAGNRGCWGKRLGYLELKIIVALLIWTFEFELPDKFVSWDTQDSLVTAPKKCLVRIREL